MKKLLLAGLMFLAGTSAWAFSWGDVRSEFVDNANFKLFESGFPQYFYDFKSEQEFTGIVTHLEEYRFLSFDVGAKDPGRLIDSSVILGPSLQVEKFTALVFPKVNEKIRALLPQSMDRFADHFTLGFAGYYDSSTKLSFDNVRYVISSGLSFGGPTTK